MRSSHLLALVGVVVLGVGFLLVFDREPEPTAEAAPSSTLADMPSTTQPLVLAAELPGADEIATGETELTEAAIARSTTTTVAPATTTTAAATAPQPTASPSPTTTTATTQPTPSGGFNSGHESDFRSRINSLRASEGLDALASSGSLNSHARSWSQTMAGSGQLGHSGFGAENVGRGGSVGGIFNALANSGGHRVNMLGDFTHFGVGVWVDGDGVIWTTHVFSR